MLSWRLVAPCTRVAHGHRLGARLVLESLRVVARLELAPARRPRRAAAPIVGAGAWITGPAVVAAAIAVLALAVVWPPLPGVRSSAIFVIVTAAVLLAPPTSISFRRSLLRYPATANCDAGENQVTPGRVSTFFTHGRLYISVL